MSNSSAAQRKQRWFDMVFKVVGPLTVPIAVVRDRCGTQELSLAKQMPEPYSVLLK
jgi:hypothetical protein